jgi:hypothetical protein
MAFNGTVTNEPLNFGGLGMTGGRRFRLSTLDFSATGYPLAGEPVVAADFDLPVAIEAIMLVASPMVPLSSSTPFSTPRTARLFWSTSQTGFRWPPIRTPPGSASSVS